MWRGDRRQLRAGHLDGLRVGRVALRNRDRSEVDHLVEDVGAALFGALDVVRLRGIEHGGGLRESREERRLGDRERREVGLAKVGLGRGFDAVGLIAVIDLVEVQLEDLLLRVRARDLDGEDRLLDLARDGDLPAHDALLHQLLRDRRRATHDVLVQEVVAHGASDAEDVDPRIGPERLVLGRDRRVDDQLRDRAQRNDLPSLDLELVEERLSIPVEDLGRLGKRVPGEVFRGWQVGGEKRERAHRAESGEREEGDDQRDHDRGHDREPAANAAPTPAPQLAIRSAPESVVACRIARDGSIVRPRLRPISSA